jgi:hypothetical protein
MNNKSILLSVTALALVMVVALSINTKKKANEYFAKAKAEKSKKELAEAKGSFDFFQEMRANPLTGKIETEDINAVLKQVKLNRDNAFKTTALPMLEWQERGPDNIGGRTRAVYIDINDANKLYMGQTSGGFWTSPNRGDDWNKMAGMDSASRMSVSCITQAANGDVYYGTGESFANISGVGQGGGIPGGGIFKSTDGGLSSNLLTATQPPFDNISGTWTYINRLTAHPTDPNHIYAAINRGLYETKDGGTSWSKVIIPSIPFLDVDISSDGSVILASSSSQMYLSTDGGATFDLGINTTARGLPGSGGIGRIEVEVSPSDNNYMYCVMSSGGQTKGIYKSSDKGQNWTAIGVGGSQTFNPLGSQGNYNIALGIHPTNPDMVFVGGQLDLYRYTPSNLWEPIAYWVKSSNAIQNGRYVHADMHGIEFNPSAPDEMYVITDGGFFRTADCTQPFPFFIEKNKNYATAQCYGVAANVLGHIIFGTQDNGTNLINGDVANSPNRSKDAFGGDGMRGAASDINTKYFFGTSQFGVLRGTTDGGTSTAAYNSPFDANIDRLPANNVDGEPDEGGPWISPVTLKENYNGTATKSVLFIGLNQNVWFTQRAIVNTANVWFPLHTAASSYSAVTLSDDGKVAFVGTGGGAVFRITGIDLFDTKYKYDDTTGLYEPNNTAIPFGNFSMDTNFVVTQITGPFSGHITDLECNEDGSELIITTPRYGVANHVFRSTNALAASPTVASIQGIGTGRLPAMPVYSAAILDEPDHYLVGTDLGVWGTENGGASWVELNNISGDENEWHPRAAVMQIAVKPTLDGPNGYYSGEIVYTGTYGRGTFMSTTLSTQWPTSTKDITKAGDELNIYPNPVRSTANLNYTALKSGTGIVKVINLNGRIVQSTMVQFEGGKNKLTVDMSSISKGVYMVAITAPGGTKTAKIVKR